MAPGAEDLARERRTVELVAPDPAWAGRAAVGAAMLAGVLGDNLVICHHIGSTAIPGIRAKPTVDLMPIVRDIAAVDAAEEAIRALGFEFRGEFGLPGRRYCPMDDPATGKRAFNVHIYQAGSGEAARHLAFRDYLRAHSDEARAYEAAKARAAALHPDDTLAYNEAKADWIVACEARALAWARDRQDRRK